MVPLLLKFHVTFAITSLLGWSVLAFQLSLSLNVTSLLDILIKM